jgi:hypothetical protein
MSSTATIVNNTKGKRERSWNLKKRLDLECSLWAGEVVAMGRHRNAN